MPGSKIDLDLELATIEREIKRLTIRYDVLKELRFERTGVPYTGFVEQDHQAEPPTARSKEKQTLVDFAVEVLQETGREMTITELLEAVRAQKPDVGRGTLSGSISAEKRKHQPRVLAVRRGVYDLPERIRQAESAPDSETGEEKGGVPREKN